HQGPAQRAAGQPEQGGDDADRDREGGLGGRLELPQGAGPGTHPVGGITQLAHGATLRNNPHRPGPVGVVDVFLRLVAVANVIKRGNPRSAGDSCSRHLISATTSPLPTVAPTSAERPVIVPALWALSGCSIFIASMTTTTSPSATSWPSSTATLTMVPCIGEVTESPVAAEAALRPPARLAFLAPPPPLPAAARPAGRTTSSRRPPTSTVTLWRSSASGASARSPAYGGIWLSKSVSIQVV